MAWGISLFNLPELFRQRSLRYRILLAGFIWFSLIMLSAAILLPKALHDYLDEQMTEQASLHLDELSALVDFSQQGELLVQGQLSDPRFREPYSGWYWQVQSGSDVLRSRSLWDAQFDITRGEEPDDQDLILNERHLTFSSQARPIQITVAMDSEPTEQTFELLTNGLMLALLAIGISSMLLIALQSYWSLRPMSTLQEDLKRVHEGKIDRLCGQYPDEVQPVVDDLNRLLFHYSELLQRARHHTGNLAHALKTPLAVIVNETATLPQSQQQVLKLALEQLQNRINYHLGRARMAGSSKILAVDSCPADVVDSLAMVFEKAYASRDIVVINELDDRIRVAVEVRDLEEMLGNLLENAFKWAASQIRVYAKQIDTSLCLFINDDGPGLLPAQMDLVLQRGVRLDEQTPGSGLGLNIVRDIVTSYRGTLTLATGPSGGLQVQLQVPLVSPVS